jgi:eukaryotic-like serine/threonine-protein kinase
VTDAADRLTSALADRYRIERELGRGGMATVYLAQDLKHDRQVAIKVLRPELAAVVGAERFLQEIRISARLDHPHILTLIDSGENDGVVWYVLPYVRGESLRDRLRREKQLSIDDAVRIVTQLAGALDYAHRRGVIHRDIKPENVLLHEGEAVIADFGIALAVREAGGDRLTESGLSLGTPQYMSPEQATGADPVDARSDVFSLGAVLYEMLAGEPPHSGPTAQAVVAKLLTERPTPIRTVRDTVPDGLETIVARALAKAPADRFATAAEFAAALAAGNAGPAPRGRRRPGVAVTVIIGAVALAAVAAAWHPWRQVRRPAPDTAGLASVAVLPFDNRSGDPKDQYLSDGMTEEVIGQLAQVRGLKVISRTSTEALKGTHLTLRQIADTLGVRHILEGSVSHVGDRIRVTTDLIDAATDATVWASIYDRALTDVFAVQEEVARHVADSLVSTVGVRRAVSPVSRTESREAYAEYLSGRYLLYRRTQEGLRTAMEQFQRAIADDSAYAPSHAGLATVYLLSVFYAYPGLDYYQANGRALVAAERAVRLDSALAEGYAARGLINTLTWAPASAIAGDFQRALELRPNSPDVHQWYATFLARQGRYPDALAEVEQAVALDPLAPGVRAGFATISLAARHYDVVVREAERALAIEPGLVRARELEGLGDLLLGNAGHCASLGLGRYAGVRAMCLYSLGRKDEARRIADSLGAAFRGSDAGDSTVSPVVAARGLAEYAAWIGDASGSLTWLQRAYALSPVGEDFRAIASGLYDQVRKDPRFEAGLQQAQARIYDRVQFARHDR